MELSLVTPFVWPGRTPGADARQRSAPVSGGTTPRATALGRPPPSARPRTCARLERAAGARLPDRAAVVVPPGRSEVAADRRRSPLAKGAQGVEGRQVQGAEKDSREAAWARGGRPARVQWGSSSARAGGSSRAALGNRHAVAAVPEAVGLCTV